MYITDYLPPSCLNQFKNLAIVEVMNYIHPISKEKDNQKINANLPIDTWQTMIVDKLTIDIPSNYFPIENKSFCNKS